VVSIDRVELYNVTVVHEAWNGPKAVTRPQIRILVRSFAPFDSSGLGGSVAGQPSALVIGCSGTVALRRP
jgi:hypothetical protein